MHGNRFQRNSLQFVRFWLPVSSCFFLFVALFLHSLPRNSPEGVAEKTSRGRLRPDAVYDAAVGNSISRLLKSVWPHPPFPTYHRRLRSSRLRHRQHQAILGVSWLATLHSIPRHALAPSWSTLGRVLADSQPCSVPHRLDPIVRPGSPYEFLHFLPPVVFKPWRRTFRALICRSVQ